MVSDSFPRALNLSYSVLPVRNVCARRPQCPVRIPLIIYSSAWLSQKKLVLSCPIGFSTPFRSNTYSIWQFHRIRLAFYRLTVNRLPAFFHISLDYAMFRDPNDIQLVLLLRIFQSFLQSNTVLGVTVTNSSTNWRSVKMLTLSGPMISPSHFRTQLFAINSFIFAW